MKLSKSKMALAKEINENGGWSAPGEFQFAAANGYGCITFHTKMPARVAANWFSGFRVHVMTTNGFKLSNWHQTILSREEYYHLYPHGNTDTGAYEMPSNSDPEAKPTIEQLAKEYRDANYRAAMMQREANIAANEAYEKHSKLEAAGREMGFFVKHLRARAGEVFFLAENLMIGDMVWCEDCTHNGVAGVIGEVIGFGKCDDLISARVTLHDGTEAWSVSWRFIRRP